MQSTVTFPKIPPSSLSLSLSSSSHYSIMSTATDSPRSDSNNIHKYKHAAPIPILTSPHRRRPSTSSDGSPTSPPTVQTPNPLYPTNLAPSSPTSPSFLSYLISTSPKTNPSFPYKRPSSFGSSPPVFEGRFQSSFCCLFMITQLKTSITLSQMTMARRSKFGTRSTNVVRLRLGPVMAGHPNRVLPPHL